MILVVMTKEYSYDENIIAIGSIVILTGYLDDRVDIFHQLSTSINVSTIY